MTKKMPSTRPEQRSGAAGGAYINKQQVYYSTKSVLMQALALIINEFIEDRGH